MKFFKLKNLCIILFVFLLINCSLKTQELDAKHLNCVISIEKSDKSKTFDDIQLTFENKSNKSGTFVLPKPLNEDFEELTFPYMFLTVSNIQTKSSEAFAYTFFNDQTKTVNDKIIISAQDKVSFDYPAVEFCRWGPCGPARKLDFSRYFKPGKTKLIFKTTIIINESGEKIESQPVDFFCSIQKGLFKNLPTGTTNFY